MQTIKSYTNNRLAGLYPPAERQALLRILAEDICRIPFYKILMDEPLDLSPDVEARLRDAIDRLAGGEPIQYILGEIDVNRAKFDPLIPTNEEWGEIKGDTAIIYINVFNSMLEKKRFSRKSFLSWAEKKNLIETQGGQPTKVKKVGGKSCRCVFLKMDPDAAAAEQDFQEIYEQEELPFD